MKKCLNIENIAYSVDNVGDDLEVEVNGIIELHNEYEKCIEFSLEYKGEELDYYSIIDSDYIDFENLGISLKELEDSLFDILPMEDIDREVQLKVEEKKQEDREYLEYLKHSDIHEYICVVRNNFGGYDYE